MLTKQQAQQRFPLEKEEEKVECTQKCLDFLGQREYSVGVLGGGMGLEGQGQEVCV